MNDKVSHLHVVPSAGDSGGIVQSIVSYLRTAGLLEEFDADDIELEQARGDEVELGRLTRTEQEFFTLSHTVHAILRDEMLELEARYTDRLASIQREEKVPFVQAAQLLTQEADLGEDMRNVISILSLAEIHSGSSYEWSLRARFNEWKCRIIVRQGFVAYAYG